MATEAEPAHWPTEIRYICAEKILEVEFGKGASYRLPAELLRVESPSAEVMGHGEGKKIISGRRYVGITEIEPVGNYAVRIHFDDMHNTGIYTWTYLHHLGESKYEVWAHYLAALETRNLSRDP